MSIHPLLEGVDYWKELEDQYCTGELPAGEPDLESWECELS
jgi:hypothetical protein